MQRLSLAELKAQKNNVIANLEAIKGGNAGNCHCPVCEQRAPQPDAGDPKAGLALAHLVLCILCQLN